MDEVSPASPPPHTASYISPVSVPLKIPPTLERDEHGKSPSRVEREEDDDEDRTDLKGNSISLKNWLSFSCYECLNGAAILSFQIKSFISGPK